MHGDVGDGIGCLFAEARIERNMAKNGTGRGITDRPFRGDADVMAIDTTVFRDEPRPDDVRAVRELVAGTGLFRPGEVDVAAELVDERLAKGGASGYHFFLADRDARLAGYVCYGPIPCTVGSYDLYWIAVDRKFQGRGLGLRLMAMAEEAIRDRGGRSVYVETGGKELYRPTRSFYVRAGYSKEAELSDFYEPGDAKVVFRKIL